MNEQTDPELLRAYADGQSEAAFAELARRHVDFVHSAARRMVHDAHLAEDVTQGVFLALARDASRLTDHPVLSAWLHRTARNLAANAVRTEARRRERERKAAAMSEPVTTGEDSPWEDIAPHLDDAIGDLSGPDRDAVLLRYFERKTAREMARTLGTSEEAAQRRVSRAVDRLRALLVRRGVVVSAGGLTAALSTHVVQAAPAALGVSVCTVTTKTLTQGAAAAAGAWSTITMTTLQKALIGTAIVVAAGWGIHRARQTPAEPANTPATPIATASARPVSAQQPFTRARPDATRPGPAVASPASAAAPVSSDPVPPPAQPASPDASPAASVPSPVRDLPVASWRDAGFASPEDTLLTRGWAVLNGQRERFKESVFLTDTARQTLEDMFVRAMEASNDPNKAQMIQQMLDHRLDVKDGLLMPMMAEHRDRGYTGYRILSEQSPAAEERILNVEVQLKSGQTRNEQVQLRQFEEGWKVVIDEAFIRRGGK